jgi:hypothetical protein
MGATANISNSPTTCELDCLGTRLSDCGPNPQVTLQTAEPPTIVKILDRWKNSPEIGGAIG